MPIRSPLRWFAALAIALSLSCRDATSPDGNRLALPDSPSRQVGSLQGPLNIPIADNNLGGAALGWTGTGLSVPPWTSYVVRIEGRTTVSSNPIASQCNPVINAPYGAEGSYGPSGDRYYQLRAAAGWMTSGGVASIAMNYVGYGTSGGDEAHSDTLFTWEGGQVAMSRSGIAGSTNGSNPPGCLAGLYLLSSSQTIALETFDDQNLTVTPSSVAVRKGTQVSFTATSGGTPVSAPHWRFDADSGVLNETGACGLNGPNPCLVTVKNSGRLRVAKNIQGRMRSTQARVTVYSSFTLDADKTTLVSGDSVTFTPKLDGMKSRVARWLWRGDDSSVVAAPCPAETDTCVRRPNRSGTMWAFTATTGGDSASKQVTVSPPTLQLTASKSTLEAPGENVRFTVTASGPMTVLGWSFTTTAGGTLASPGSAWGACSPSSSQCTNLVSETGTVDVLGVVNGYTLRASVHVRVVPCPIDSAPPLNEPNVRSDLLKLMSRSGWIYDAGDGIAPSSAPYWVGYKRERAGDIYRRPDGSYYFQEDTLAISTECWTERSTMNTRHSPEDVKVGDVHTEPTEEPAALYSCGPDPMTGDSAKRGPMDSTRTYVPHKPPPEAMGGGSLRDWFSIAQLPENQNGPAVDGYVVQANGEIWRLPAQKALALDGMTWRQNRQRWRWNRNQNPSCNWVTL